MAIFRTWKGLAILVSLALVLALGAVAVPMTNSILANGEVTFFSEDFEGGLPGDWTVVNNGGFCTQVSCPTWTDSDPCSRTALDGCSGIFMIADYLCCGYPTSYMDTELWTPSIDCSTYSTVTLEFDHYCLSWGDRVDVDISNDGGLTWTNILIYIGNFSGHVSANVSADAAGESNVVIRWHSYNVYWYEYWEVDNVELSGTPPPTPPTPPPPGVPTINHWGIVAMITLFAGLLLWRMRRRRLAS